MSPQSQCVTIDREVENPDKSTTLKPETDGKRGIRRGKIGSNLTATVPATFSQVCSGWNVSKTSQPYQVVLNTSRFDLMESGRSLNSVLIVETRKLRGSCCTVNNWNGYNLHRACDVERAADWALVNAPRVVWFSVPCRYWDGVQRTSDWKETLTKVVAGRREER